MLLRGQLGLAPGTSQGVAAVDFRRWQSVADVPCRAGRTAAGRNSQQHFPASAFRRASRGPIVSPQLNNRNATQAGNVAFHSQEWKGEGRSSATIQ